MRGLRNLFQFRGHTRPSVELVRSVAAARRIAPDCNRMITDPPRQGPAKYTQSRHFPGSRAGKKGNVDRARILHEKVVAGLTCILSTVQDPGRNP